MSNRLVKVTAPSRLHFGLLAFGRQTGRRFGGAGLMIDRPVVELVIESARQWRTSGLLCERVEQYASRWARFQDRPLPACHVHVAQSPRPHVGLGTGTQLALSVAAGLSAFCDLPGSSPAELALSVGRGQRSAVGTYGFALGGLIVERGKTNRQLIAPLDCRLAVPASWRVLLVCPRRGEGLSGKVEQRAFDSLPPVPPEITRQLEREIREGIVPAAAQGDFDQFSASVYRYGRAAGLCFARQQGGPYNGPLLTSIVDAIRRRGVQGVGQSSWGPTIFAFLPDEERARTLEGQLRSQLAAVPLNFSITRPANRGARIAVKTAIAG